MTTGFPAAIAMPRKDYKRSRTSPNSVRNSRLFRPTPANQSLTWRPTHQTARATLYPEVTVPFCRLPLLTLCSRLETLNLGHLLRFMERLHWKMILSL